MGRPRLHVLCLLCGVVSGGHDVLAPVGQDDLERVTSVETWLEGGALPPSWGVTSARDVKQGSQLAVGRSKRVSSGRLAESDVKVVVKTAW